MGVIPDEVGHPLTLQSVGDDATRTVYIEHVYGPATMWMFLNKVVHFDFAQARFRAEDENDFDWKYSKWSEDEEGAIGVQMYALLGLTAFPQPGPRYL